MNRYAFNGKFKAREGQRDKLVSILLQASKLVSTAKGCHQYIIYKDPKDDNSVFVSEIWDTKEDHDNSLKIEGCRELISTAMPLIDGRPEGTELEVIGGKGIDF
jgi:quinol monooxygenase YgiN